MISEEQINPLRRTVVLSWILFNINNVSMIFYKHAVINEVYLIYSTNIMQIVAIAWLAHKVFNELLVICKIKMWKVKPE